MPFQNQMRPRRGMAFQGPKPNSDFGNHSWLMNQLIAGGEGALDGATWGMADRAYAGLGALVDATQGGSVKEDYRRRMAYEQARDQYYAEHDGTARTLGEIGGALLPIPGVGPAGVVAKAIGRTARFAEYGKALELAGKVGERIKQATPLAKHERTVVSGLGAAAGAGGQLYSDSVNGHLSSWGDYAGAMGGGALQAQMALHMRPMLAGAGGGAATSALQDLFSGRRISKVNAAEAAGAGAVMGKLGDAIGRADFYHGMKNGVRVVSGNEEKEKAGEAFSKLRTLANFDWTASTAKKKLALAAGGHTFPDQITRRKQYIESKAGIWARLRVRQLQALAQEGLNYRVDHLLPKDYGTFVGYLAALGGHYLPAYLQQGQDPESR